MASDIAKRVREKIKRIPSSQCAVRKNKTKRKPYSAALTCVTFCNLISNNWNNKRKWARRRTIRWRENQRTRKPGNKRKSTKKILLEIDCIKADACARTCMQAAAESSSNTFRHFQNSVSCCASASRNIKWVTAMSLPLVWHLSATLSPTCLQIFP